MFIEIFHNYLETSSFVSMAYDAFVVLLFVVAFILFFIHSKSARQKSGLILFVVLLYVLGFLLQAQISNTIMGSIIFNMPVILVVLFLDEIKEIAKNFDFNFKRKKRIEDNSHVVRIIANACETLSKNRTGALIVLEGTQRLDSLIQKSIIVNGEITEEILITIFNTSTPMHDGAIIVRDAKLVCAGAFFQPSTNPNISKELGSRHRAAIGASEMYDSLIIVVSEETGKISVAKDSILDRGVDKDALIKYIEDYI